MEVTTAKRHAPRGPIKARDRKDEIDHMEAPRCTATAKGSRQRCKRFPIPGGTVCVKHGGGAPQVQAAAKERLRQLEHPAVDALAWLLNQRDFPSATMSAIRETFDRNWGKPAETVAVDHSGEMIFQWKGGE